MQRARDKSAGAGVGAGNEEDAIVAALAKTGGGSGGGGGDDAEDDGGAGLPPARRAKVSINIFEDVDDRWVQQMRPLVRFVTARPSGGLDVLALCEASPCLLTQRLCRRVSTESPVGHSCRLSTDSDNSLRVGSVSERPSRTFAYISRQERR